MTLVSTFISFLSELPLKFKRMHPLSIHYMNIISADTAIVFEFLGIVQSNVFMDCKRLCVCRDWQYCRQGGGAAG